MVPRAYGGADGPQISLCDSHHNMMHKIALALITKSNYFKYLSGSKEQDKRSLYLAATIQKSHALYSKDPNKRITVVSSFSSEEMKTIAALKKVLGLKSQSSVVRHAVQLLAARTFLPKT